MTRELGFQDVAAAIERALPGAVVQSSANLVLVDSDKMAAVAKFLREAPGMEFDFLTSVSAVDYLDYFEVVYHLLSIKNNESTVIKTRAYSRDYPAVPSVVNVWQGADFQEREIFDLMGVIFTGHPNLKRIMLWEGFEGHPLRKDYIVVTPS
ncbi:MAG: NADH-quinone oxidoreductase subunit C [Dehalococcoidia bacterium]|nr:NADH-quinone oxidoreductase subunit C [Dehalococcoidia bacterium]